MLNTRKPNTLKWRAFLPHPVPTSIITVLYIHHAEHLTENYPTEAKLRGSRFLSSSWSTSVANYCSDTGQDAYSALAIMGWLPARCRSLQPPGSKPTCPRISKNRIIFQHKPTKLRCLSPLRGRPNSRGRDPIP